MNIAVVGTGYVGLVTGTCFAETGNKVFCVDIDEKKVQNLKNGINPIYEPGLEDLLKRNIREGRLFFTTSLPEIIDQVSIIFIAVGTPTSSNGSADLQYVRQVAEDIGNCINDYKVIVNKSTVPVGTGHMVNDIIQEAISKKIKEVEIIPGKGSGQLKKKVLRFLEQKEIKQLYHRIDKDSKNFGRLFVYFKH